MASDGGPEADEHTHTIPWSAGLWTKVMYVVISHNCENVLFNLTNCNSLPAK